jgi:hypothetical protein
MDDARRLSPKHWSNETTACGEEFLQLLCSSLGITAIAPAANMAAVVASELKKIGCRWSPRQVQRWGEGKSLLRPATFRNELIAKLKAQGISPGAIARLHAAYDRYVEIGERRRRAAVSRSALPDASTCLSLTSDIVEKYLLRLHEEKQKRYTWYRPVPCPFRSEIWNGTEWTERKIGTDIPRTLTALYLSQVTRPIRVLLTGPAGSGKSRTCEDVTYRLAKQHASERVTGGSTRIPVLVDWSRWIKAISRLRRDHRWIQVDLPAIAAKAFFDAAEFDFDFTPRACVAAAASGEFVLICDGVDNEEFGADPNTWTAIRDFCRDVRYMLVACRDINSTAETDFSGVFTRRLTVYPASVRLVAASVRQQLRAHDPALPWLLNLGDALRTLEAPGIAGRVGPLIASGWLPPEVLQGDTFLLAWLYVLDVLHRLGREPEDVAEPFQSSEAVWETIKTKDVDARQILARAELDSNLEGRRIQDPSMSVSRLSSGGGWIHPDILWGIWFVRKYLSIVLHTAEKKPSFRESLAAGDETNGAPLYHVDGEAFAFLASKSQDDIWQHLRWKELIESVEADLRLVNASKEGTATDKAWPRLTTKWTAFQSALGILRGRLTIMSPSEPATNNLAQLADTCVATLRDTYSPALQWRAQQENLRIYSARAAAMLYRRARFVDEFLSLSESPTDDRADEAHFCSQSAFYSDVLVELCARRHFRDWGRDNTILLSVTNEDISIESAPQAICDGIHNLINRLVPQPGIEENLYIRRARFHCFEALARVGPPAAHKLTFLPLLENIFKFDRNRSSDIPPRAIETAICVGALANSGAVLPIRENLPKFAEELIGECAEEVRHSFWRYGSETETPLVIRCHVFLAQRWLARLMTVHQRTRLLNSLQAHFVPTSADAKNLAKETACLRYLLYWIRDELRDGIPPQQGLLGPLSEIYVELLIGVRDLIEGEQNFRDLPWHQNHKIVHVAGVRILSFLRMILQSCSIDTDGLEKLAESSAGCPGTK